MNTLFSSCEEKIKQLRRDADILEESMNDPRVEDHILFITMELSNSFPSWSSKEKEPTWSVSGENVTIRLGSAWGSCSVDYSDMLDKKDAHTNYSGDRLEVKYREKLLFSNIEIAVDFSAEIPADDVEFLKVMNKIVESTNTTLHAIC